MAVRRETPTRSERPEERGYTVEGSHPSLAVYFNRAANWFDDALQTNLRRHGLLTTSRTQSQVIANLGLGVIRPTHIARKIGISPQAMSQVLSDMVNMGLIHISTDRDDGRARVVGLTKAGKDYLAEVRPILFAMEMLLEERFGRPVIDVVRMVVEADWGKAPQLDLPEEEG